VLGQDVAEAVAARRQRVVEAAVALSRDREDVPDAVGGDRLEDVFGGVQMLFPSSLDGRVGAASE
jgi:hypothetical protein